MNNIFSLVMALALLAFAASLAMNGDDKVNFVSLPAAAHAQA